MNGRELKALSCSACKKRIEPEEDYILLQRIVMTETSLSIGNRYYHVRHGGTPRRRVAENPERWHMVLKKAGGGPNVNRGGGRNSGGLGTVILAAIGFAIGMGIMSYAYGDLFNPGIWVGMGIGWAVGLLLVYFFRRRP